MSRKKNKNVTNLNIPPNRKQAVAVENPDIGRDQPIVWKFHKMVLDKNRPWNWCQLEESKKMQEVFKKLGFLEQSSFNELNADSRHHSIPKENFKSREVHRELEILGVSDVASLFSLRLAGKVRVYCIFSMNQFSLLWYDPNHEIYP